MTALPGKNNTFLPEQLPVAASLNLHCYVYYKNISYRTIIGLILIYKPSLSLGMEKGKSLWGR